MNHNPNRLHKHTPDEYHELSGDDAAPGDLTVQRTDGSVERGWTMLGHGIKDGVPYTRVGRILPDGRRATKDVATDRLNRWQEQSRTDELETGYPERSLGIRATGAALDDIAHSIQMPNEITRESDGVLEKYSSRIRRLATPLETSLDGGIRNYGSRFDYESLWNVSDEEEPVDIEKAAIRRSARETAKPHMIDDALLTVERVMRSDSRLRDTLIAKGLDTMSTRSVVEELRRNHALRCELITYFEAKLEDIRSSNPTILPERVRRNDRNNLKSPNSDGYPVDKMTSFEYVSMLALSMLDGSFDASRADTTQSHVNADGTPGYGQHRTAAYVLLTKDSQI